MPWEDLIALLSMLCGAVCTAAGMAASARQRHRGEETDDEAVPSPLAALTPDDKAWLRSHGWNGALRTRSRP